MYIVGLVGSYPNNPSRVKSDLPQLMVETGFNETHGLIACANCEVNIIVVDQLYLLSVTIVMQGWNYQ